MPELKSALVIPTSTSTPRQVSGPNEVGRIQRNADCSACPKADIDSGIAVAVMRNRFNSGDLTTVARIDRIIAETLPQTPRTGGRR
jgi:hypothetical protein